MAILDSIGKSPLFELLMVVPMDCGREMAKLEFTNTPGSMKDRMALPAI